MSAIQEIEKLQHYLSGDKLSKLEKAADRHRAQSNIKFSIHSIADKAIEVETIQGETPSGKYATEATLIKRTEDLFHKSLPGFKVTVHTQTYLPSPSSVVNTSWIEKKMDEKGIRIKQIAFETGVDRDSISDWVTGKRSMSQIVKAMFYFYLSR